ncbi:hypothetical protein FVEN_g2022 [Fusarium venenatum]|uniref:Uncharacterized protein n=1 Tax=Fusarium venenatum TaxID=56646 RepID=A0A2L2SPG3_9HYPO|nr:uncharacterized protein FVRRES_12435 [Fusarium venenatum]KAG8360235.1 hypothetical protein FVEN_g2022 [Fusarium venenatum]CEI39744.1 unnamed protein product [Fusarium venenatum]
MSQFKEIASPPWGSLPVECYLLSKWDSSLSLSVEEQREALVKAFIQENDISDFTSISGEALAVDRQELIQTVLVPWRSQKLRRIAEKYNPGKSLFDVIIVLRTYYGGDSDNKFSRWIKDASDTFDDMDPSGDLFGPFNERWWRVFDDPSLFDMGSQEWQAVYTVLPELATPELQREFNDQDVREAKELASCVCDSRNPEEGDYEDAICATANIGFWLIVADEEAFNDKQLLLVFMDKKGNVVRQAAVNPNDLPNLPHYILRGSITESGFWSDAEVGKKYKTRGQIMRAVLPLVMAESK